MDRISHLPEDLLLRILSFLPTTKDVVATMVLSKRWQFLWMLVPRLVYDDDNWNTTEGSFSRFVDRSLLLHEAPVLDYLHFKLGQKSSILNIGVWAQTVARRHVRELLIEIDRSSYKYPTTIPKSLYTVSGMLVRLDLENVVLADESSPVSFPSLKKLCLLSIKYQGGDEYVDRLLSNCPVLEELYVDQCPHDNITVFIISVPSLKILTIWRDAGYYDDDDTGFVIDTPSLQILGIIDCTDGFYALENEMPNFDRATIESTNIKILGCLTPVKELSLCLSSSQDAYPSGYVFHRLVDFRLCRCKTQWLNILTCMLRDSPKLRTLILLQIMKEQKKRKKWWNIS